MAEGYSAADDASGQSQLLMGSNSMNHSWDGQGRCSSAGAQPPLGRRAVSAYSSSKHNRQADFRQSTLSLVTCVLGAGALGYPFCFKECGLLLATIIMFVTLIATRISYQLLLYSAQLSGRKSYEGIAEHALGKTGRQIVELCVAAMNLGALVAFLDILADVLSAVAGTIIPPGAEPSRHAYIIGVTITGALPVSLVVRDPTLIANMSNAAVVFVIVFAAVVFCTAFGPSAAAALGVRWQALTHSHQLAASAAAVKAPILHLWNPQGVLVSLPVMAYGFTAHQYYMGIYSMLKAPTVGRMKLVTDAALLVCAGVYWTVGVGGYATFGDRTAGDIIRNFGGTRAPGLWGAYERALKLCYGMAVLGNIPLVILPFSSILAPLLPGDDKLKQRTRILAGACTVAGAKRATAAALGGCSIDGCSAASHKRRFPSAGANRMTQAPASDGNLRYLVCEDGRVPLDVDASVLASPKWQQLSQRESVTTGGGGASRRDSMEPALQQQQQYLSEERRAMSAERGPDHPHLRQDSCRAAHLLSGPQHTLVVVLVLGVGLASAVWLPNVELIFGLTGSTASVLAAFIMPAVCFLQLCEMAPELGSSRHGAIGKSGSLWRAIRSGVSCCGCLGLGSLLNPGTWQVSRGFPPKALHTAPAAGKRQAGATWIHHSNSSAEASQAGFSKMWGPVLVVPEVRAQWLCRQRLAYALLFFGLISGMLCTDAILSSISEEKAVVQLAQELVAHEAVVAETSRAQQKAKEAAAAVDAVSSAAQQLGAVDSATNQTLGSLAAAAAALSTLAAAPSTTASVGGRVSGARPYQQPMWDLKGRIAQHKQKMAEDSVLRNVEAALSTAAADIASTTASVTAVIIKLDTSITQIKADAVAAAAAPPHTSTGSSSSSTSAPAPATAGDSTELHAPDGSVVTPPASSALGSSFIVPHGGSSSSHASAAAPSDPIQQPSETPQQQQQQPAAPPAMVLSDAGNRDRDNSQQGSGGRSGDAYARANEMAKELSKALGAFGRDGATANLTLSAGRSLEQVRDSALAALTALNVTADVLRQVRGAISAARHIQQRDSVIKDLAIQAMQKALNATAASALAMRITRDALGTAATEETSELLTALNRVAQDLEKDKITGSKRPTVTVTSDSDADDAVGSSSMGLQAQDAQAVSTAVPDDAVGSPVPGNSVAASQAAGLEGGQSSGAVVAPAVHPPADLLPKHPTLAEHTASSAAAANAAAHADAESSNLGQQQYQQRVTATGPAVPIPAVAEVGPVDVSPGSRPAPIDGVSASNTAGEAAGRPAVAAEGAAGGGAADQRREGSSSTIEPGAAAGGVPPTSVTAERTSSQQDAQHSVLSATEANKVKSIISHLAAAISASSGSSSTSSSTGSNSQQLPAAANITALAIAVHDAVAWTEQSKAAVLGLMAQGLSSTDPKVAQRVIGIVQEVSTTETEADRQKEQLSAAKATAAAVTAAAGGQGRPTTAPTAPADATGTPTINEGAPSQATPAHLQLQQQGVGSAAEAVEAGVAGPVVTPPPQAAAADGVWGPVVHVEPSTGAVGRLAAPQGVAAAGDAVSSGHAERQLEGSAEADAPLDRAAPVDAFKKPETQGLSPAADEPSLHQPQLL